MCHAVREVMSEATALINVGVRARLRVLVAC